MPYILEPERERERYFFTERRHYDKKNGSDEMNKLKAGEKYALRTNEYKFIYATEQEDEFYYLADDPEELNNILIKNNQSGIISSMSWEDKEALRKQADNFHKLLSNAKKALEKKGMQFKSSTIVDEEVLERLKALGYIQ